MGVVGLIFADLREQTEQAEYDNSKTDRLTQSLNTAGSPAAMVTRPPVTANAHKRRFFHLFSI